MNDAPDLERDQLERAVASILDELRRRLGSSFTMEELADVYATDVDWADDLAGRHGAGTDASWAVDAAFGRYVREATNFAGGRRRLEAERTG